MMKEGKKMSGTRRTTFDERRNIVQYCLENGTDYQKTCRVYGVSYRQIYTWVSKYRRYGAAGLADRRGRSRSCPETVELDDLFRLQIENEILRAVVRSLKNERMELKKHVSYLQRKYTAEAAS